MIVSLFVHDLSANPIVRAGPLAKALRRLGFDVEVLGLLVSGDEVYEPYRGQFPYVTKRSSRHIIDVIRTTRTLAEEASGDVIYACKPLWTSLWPALLASGFGREKPLLLDVEDRELWLNTMFSFARFVKIHLVRNWTDAGALRYKLLLHPFAKTAPTAVTVSTRALQQTYGGSIVLHGPDTEEFSPESVNLSKEECREKFDLPRSAPLALFAGTPQPHKGLDTVVKALQHDVAKDYHLVLAGSLDHATFQEARAALENRCHLLGFVDNNKMYQLLHAVDVIPIMQKENPYTQAQMPAKLLEAMAMAKNIVVSPVGDLPRIIGVGTDALRGWVAETKNDQQLAETFRHIADNPDQAKRRRERARQFVQQQASTTAIAERLQKILAQITSGNVSPSQ
jgi:glycosyltransferase involved in cell wall biosynthesis